MPLDFPDLPILHVDDIGRLPSQIPTIHKPFGSATLRDAVRRPLPGS